LRPLRTLGVIAVASAVLLAACGSSNKGAGTSPSTSGKLTGSITVLAGSSLTTSFTALGEEFQTAHPGTKIEFSFGSSSDLEKSIEQGAPADVFASADQKNMTKLVAAGDNSGSPTNFAKNKLEMAVEKGNPKHIARLSDLSKPGLVVVLCDPSAPCGKYAAQVLANAKVHLTPKSLEANVKATLSKVELGEADAAIVYVSDIATSGKVEGVQIPDHVNVLATLPIVALKGSKNPTLAKAWVDFVVSHQSELVSKYGFLPL
jgi:molybdate transport system substrate-binding protein